MRISSSNDRSATRFAVHPNNSAICVRMDGPKVLIMWNNGYLQAPVTEIPSSWWTPVDDAGRKVPLRVKRPFLGGAHSALDVEFLKPETTSGSSGSNSGSLGSVLLQALSLLAR